MIVVVASSAKDSTAQSRVGSSANGTKKKSATMQRLQRVST